MTVLPCVQLGFAALVAFSGVAARVRLPGRGGVGGAVQLAASAPAVHAAPLLIGALAVASLAAMAFGALATRCGEIGLATSVVAILELLMLERRAIASRSTLERALHEALGPDYRERLAPDRAALRAAPVFFSPLPTAHDDVELVENLSYGDAGERNLLDLYRPRDRRSGLPILIAIHGGAWIMGHKRMQSKVLLRRMAGSGWLVVAINYRLGPTARFPDPLVDVKRAIAWARAEASRYGGDPGFVIACGESAGGHLAALAALTGNQPRYQPGFEQSDTTLSGAVAIYARLDFVDRFGVAGGAWLRDFLADNVMPQPYERDPGSWDAASPIACVHADMPPLFVLHGTHDSVVPIEEAEHFVRAARAVGRAPVAFARIKGAQHAYDLGNSRWAHASAEAISAFGERLFADHRVDRGQPPRS